MLALIDYGMGNIRSVEKAFEFIGVTPVIINDSEQLKNVSDLQGVILPGVGAFGDCMQNLKQRGLDVSIKQCMKENVPYLGICLGLQLLAKQSNEHEVHPGLGWIDSQVQKFMLDGNQEHHKKYLKELYLH